MLFAPKIFNESYEIPERFRCFIPDYNLCEQGVKCNKKGICKKVHKEVMIKHADENLLLWFYLQVRKKRRMNKLKKERNEISTHV